MNWLKTMLIRTGFFLLFLGYLVVPVAAGAQEACTCFCTSSQGAIEVGTMILGECQAKCAETQDTVVTCAKSYGEYPSRLPRCFSDDQCINAIEAANASVGQEGATFAQGSFSLTNTPPFQPPECPKEYGYCYPPQKSYELSVSFGSVAIVDGFSDYISQAYNYLLGISVTIVIVMVMIGGLQYVLSAGSGNIQKAKERISNAIIGFLLLSFAYVILFTVNPNLVSLQLPQLPMVKRVVLVGDDSCDDLEEKGFTVDRENIQDGNGQPVDYEDAWCGTSTVVLSDNNGNPVADGTTCDWRMCEDPDKQCASTSPPSCMKCSDVTISSGLTASVGLCQSLTDDRKNTEDANNKPDLRHMCVYTTDRGLTGSITEATNVFGGMCASIEMNCTSMRSCRDYDSVKAVTGEETECLESLGYVLDGDFFSAVRVDGPDLIEICRQDPCSLAPPNESCEPILAPNATRGFEIDCVNSGFATAYQAEVRTVSQSTVGFATALALEIITFGGGAEATTGLIYGRLSAAGYALDKKGARDVFNIVEDPTCEFR